MQRRAPTSRLRRAPAQSHALAVAIGMFAVLLVSYAINAMDRQLFPLLVTNVRREYHFSLADAGLLSTVFTLGMAIAGIPTGYLLTRLSRKAVMLFGIALFSAAMVLTAFSVGFWDMLAYRAITGLGEAMQLTALLAIAAGYFTRYRAAAVGSVNFSFGIGAIVGPILGGAILAGSHSWRTPVIVFGALGFVAIAIIAIVIRPWLAEADGSGEELRVTGGAPTILNRNTLLLVICSVLGGLVIYGYLGMYPTFLREHLRYSPTATGAVMSIYGLGVLVSIAGGWLGDRFSPRPVLGLAFLGAAALGYLLFHGSGSFAVQAALSFIWGLVVSGTVYVNLAGYHVKSVSPNLAGKASGVFVTSLYAPAAVAGYIIGWIVSQSSWITAGEIQISLLSLVGAATALALQPERMTVPAGDGAIRHGTDEGRLGRAVGGR